MVRSSGRIIGCLLLAATAVRGQELSVERKQKDLGTLLETIHATHPDPYAAHSREQWDETVADVQFELVEASPARFFLLLARVAALLEDGHSGLVPTGYAGSQRYPIDFEFYGDGLFVRAADPHYADAVGKRVVAISGQPVADVLAALRPYVCADNEQNARPFLEVMLTYPLILHALGIGEAPPVGTLTLANSQGGEEQLTLQKTESGPPQLFGPPPEHWTAVNPAQPLLMERAPERAYWFERLSEPDAIYMRYRVIRNDPEQSIQAFCDELSQALRRDEPERLIIDLRGNNGGNNYLTQPVLHTVIRSDYNAPGKLFVICDRGTFSAAQNCASRLERETWALFVGEPTGSRPNHFGDATAMQLPESGYMLRCSTVRWQDSDPNDSRAWIYPDLPAPMLFADYAAGRDPALAAIAAYEHQPIRGYDGVLPMSHWGRANQSGPWPLR